MLAPERQQQILTLLEERGTVRTMDLAEAFQVTDETIRRDLQALADEQRLTRIHGGASSLNGRPALRSFSERRDLRVAAKHSIAAAACHWIGPGRTFAFDSSTTAFALVSILPDLPYRVVTNAYTVIDCLVAMKHVDLISTGGRYHPKTQTFVGGESIDSLRRHNIHAAFVSCIGYDIRRGASEGFEQQAIFKERLVELADEVILLVDSSKFGARSEYFFAGPQDISHIITDSEADSAMIAEIHRHGIEVTVGQPPSSPPTQTP